MAVRRYFFFRCGETGVAHTGMSRLGCRDGGMTNGHKKKMS